MAKPGSLTTKKTSSLLIPVSQPINRFELMNHFRKSTKAVEKASMSSTTIITTTVVTSDTEAALTKTNSALSKYQSLSFMPPSKRSSESPTPIDGKRVKKPKIDGTKEREENTSEEKSTPSVSI
jgi:hypothetical protein